MKEVQFNFAGLSIISFSEKISLYQNYQLKLRKLPNVNYTMQMKQYAIKKMHSNLNRNNVFWDSYMQQKMFKILMFYQFDTLELWSMYLMCQEYLNHDLNNILNQFLYFLTNNLGKQLIQIIKSLKKSNLFLTRILRF